jgi:hypothetical protein
MKKRREKREETIEKRKKRREKREEGSEKKRG